MAVTINASTSAGAVTTADTSGVLQLQTGGTAALTVDASQNVGIGTSSPGAKLVVTGAAAGAYGAIIYNTSATGQGLTVRGGSTSSQDAFNVQTYDGGASLLSVQAGGNVGIGTSSPNYKFNVGPTSGVTSLAGAGISLFTSGSLTSNIGGVLNFRPSIGTTASDIFNLSICAYDHTGDTNADGLSINASDGISFCTGSNSRNERARIDSSGRFILGKTTTSYGTPGLSLEGNGHMQSECNTDWNLELAGSTGNRVRIFASSGITQVGGITASTTATTYATSSDYRLKEAIAPMTGALAKVSLLKPCTYKWKVDGSDGQGFIAHELAEVEAGCVTGEKDAVDSEGNPQYQGIDTSFLVATLTAAIQEQQTLITALTARITALEGAAA